MDGLIAPWMIFCVLHYYEMDGITRKGRFEFWCNFIAPWYFYLYIFSAVKSNCYLHLTVQGSFMKHKLRHITDLTIFFYLLLGKEFMLPLKKKFTILSLSNAQVWNWFSKKENIYNNTSKKRLYCTAKFIKNLSNILHQYNDSVLKVYVLLCYISTFSCGFRILLCAIFQFKWKRLKTRCIII